MTAETGARDKELKRIWSLLLVNIGSGEAVKANK